jgi:hypothetical protein
MPETRYWPRADRIFADRRFPLVVVSGGRGL